MLMTSLLFTGLAFAQATPDAGASPPAEAPAQAAPSDTAPADAAAATAPVVPAPPPVDLDNLKPTTIDPVAVTAPTTDAERAELRALADELKKSISAATAAAAKHKEAARQDGLAIKIAATELKARKLDLAAAKKDLKVQKISDSGEAERTAEAAVEAAKSAVAAATTKLSVTKGRATLDKARQAHAGTLADLEQAKLDEVEARSATPPADQAELLKIQKARAKAEVSESKARSKVSDAELKLKRAGG